MLSAAFVAVESALRGLGRFGVAELQDALGMRLGPAIGQQVAQGQRVRDRGQPTQDVGQIGFGIELLPLLPMHRGRGKTHRGGMVEQPCH